MKRLQTAVVGLALVMALLLSACGGVPPVDPDTATWDSAKWDEASWQ